MLDNLHPGARLSVWLCLVLFLQYADLYILLGTGFVFFCLSAALRQHWGRLLRRSRILLLALLLVFSYSIPGPPLLGHNWMPSRMGLDAGILHAIHLVVLLGSLAWYTTPLGVQGIMNSVWFLLAPLEPWGLPVRKSVVRLTLVLEYLDKRPKQSWRQWLDLGQQHAGDALSTTIPVTICLPEWTARDTFCVACAVFLPLLLFLRYFE